MRGATLAVVGASTLSLNAAERLSHTSGEVKVFVVHSKDSVEINAPKNGFEGVFDSRIDPLQLADTIRKSVEGAYVSNNAVPLPPRRRGNILSRFIEIQRRFPNVEAVKGAILDAFLETFGGDEGLLLASPSYGSESLLVMASRGEECPQSKSQVAVDSTCLRALLSGDFYLRQGGFSVFKNAPFSTRSLYTIGVPIMRADSPCAFLIGNGAEGTVALNEFREGIDEIFRQLHKRNTVSERESFLGNVRAIAGSCWLLADIHGNTIHQEGALTTILSRCQPRIKNARVRDLLRRPFMGQEGSAEIFGTRIAYNLFKTVSRDYALLRFESQKREGGSVEMTGDRPILRALLGSDATAEPEPNSSFEELIKDLRRSGVSERTSTIEQLKRMEIEMAASSLAIPCSIFEGVILIVIAVKRELKCPLVVRFTQEDQNWSLTVEANEERWFPENADLRESRQLKLTLELGGLVNVKARYSRFGLLVTGRIIDKLS